MLIQPYTSIYHTLGDFLEVKHVGNALGAYWVQISR